MTQKMRKNVLVWEMNCLSPKGSMCTVRFAWHSGNENAKTFFMTKDTMSCVCLLSIEDSDFIYSCKHACVYLFLCLCVHVLSTTSDVILGNAKNCLR